MSKIKFAIVGCGNIGKRHVAVVAADSRAEVVAICDIDENKCKELLQQHGDIACYTDYDQLIREIKADVISICTPHGLHAEMSIKASRSGMHSLVEKPMALTVADCKRMIAEAKQNNVNLIIVKQNRFNIPISLVKIAVREKRLGKVLLVECNVLWNRHQQYYEDSNWRGRISLEGGALYTQVSHFIDLLVWWFGDIKKARSFLSTSTHAIETEDCGTALLEFSSGALGNLTWTTSVYNKNYEGSITIIGEKGTIKIGGPYLNKIEFWDILSYPLPDSINFTDQPNEYGKYQGSSSNHDKVVSNVVAKLLNERYQTVEGDEGMKTIEAIELIYASVVK